MRIQDLDPRVRQLAKGYQRAEKGIQETLRRMVGAPVAERLLLHRQLQKQVGRLRIIAQQWVSRFMPQFYAEAEAKLRGTLERAGIRATVSASNQIGAISLGFLERVNSALFSLNALGSRLLRAGDSIEALDPASRQQIVRRVNAGIAPELARARAFDDFSKRISEHPLAVIGPSGQTRHYEMAYYASMVAQSAMVLAQSLPPKVYGPELGADLVRVSDNPSLHGDECDAYAGRVFSLSGAHPKFPALANTPNGGCPFHVNCLHTIELLLDEPPASEEPANPAYLSSDHRVVAKAWAARRT